MKPLIPLALVAALLSGCGANSSTDTAVDTGPTAAQLSAASGRAAGQPQVDFTSAEDTADLVDAKRVLLAGCRSGDRSPDMLESMLEAQAILRDKRNEGDSEAEAAIEQIGRRLPDCALPMIGLDGDR